MECSRILYYFLKPAVKIFLLSAIVNCVLRLPCAAQIDLKLQSGYQVSDLNFSIAGTAEGTHPNIFSELKWQNVVQRSYGVEAKAKFFKRINTDLQFRSAKVISGNVSDIDYATDNRTGVFSSFYGETAGFQRNIAANVGYTVFDNELIEILPGLSYFGQFQKFYLRNAAGTDVYSNPSYFIPDLNSYYRTNWNGFGASVAFKLKPAKALSVAYTFAAYRLINKGYGNWNTRTDFAQPKSYLHQANGFSFQTQAGITYAYNKHWNLGLASSYHYGLVKNGTDNLLLADGRNSLTKLNEVEFEEVSFSIAVGFRF